MNTVCSFPWEMYSIDTGFGWYRTCPRNDYQKLTDLNFYNHEDILAQRKELRDNIQHSKCWRCWESENQGSKSYRQVLGTDTAPHNVDQTLIKAPKILEIKFSNLCNQRCIFCSSNCSSLWEAIDPVPEEKLGILRGPEVAKAILEFADRNYKDIKTFQMFGGEPVLVKEFDQIFDLVLRKPISDGYKTLSFSTNMYFNDNYRKNFEDKIERVLDLGHNLYFRFSIDALRERGEYLRENLVWDVMEKNLDSFMNKFHNHPNIGRMRCNIALNITNIVYLEEMMHFIHQKGWTNVEPHYNYVAKPEHFYVQSYGYRLNAAIDMIKQQNFYEHNKYKTHVLDLLGSMSHRPPVWEEIDSAKMWLDKYDARTGKNFLELFPRNRFMFYD